MAEFRYYELPPDEPVLALMGDEWMQIYEDNVNKQHFHNLLEIGYCHYGEGQLLLENEIYRFGAEMVSCIPANILHVTKSDTGISAFWEYLFIDPEKILFTFGQKDMQEVKELLQGINQNAFYITLENNARIVMLVRAIFEEMQKKEEYYKEYVNGLVYALLLEIARYNKKQEKGNVTKRNAGQLENAVKYVETHYAENIKIADLAAQCCMNEAYFRTIFHQRMNMTPVEYVNLIRVEKACDLMEKTDVSMENVAQRVGFVTPSTFNRNFKKITGTSPYQWKKRRLAES